MESGLRLARTMARVLVRMFPKLRKGDPLLGPDVAEHWWRRERAASGSSWRATARTLWLLVADAARSAPQYWAPEARGIRGDTTMNLTTDIHHAVRRLLRTPGATAAMLVTLAIGIGATSAIFNVVDAVLLRPLPYPDDRALLRIVERHATDPRVGVSFPAFLGWSTIDTLAGVAASSADSATLTGRGEPERLEGVSVSPAFFAVLGVRAALGETLAADAPMFDPDRRVVLSHQLWQRAFGGRRDLIGQSIELDGSPHRVVGVMPTTFDYPVGTAFWASMPKDMELMASMGTTRFLDVVARLRLGATVDQLQVRLDAMAARAAAADARLADWRPLARTLRDDMTRTARLPLLLLSAAVSLLFAVACCNAGAMLLTRSYRQRAEHAVKVAIGATRGRLVREVFVETLLLAAAAAVGGLFVAYIAQKGLLMLSRGQLPRLAESAISWQTLLFTALVTLIAIGAVGIVPALSRAKASLSPGTASRALTRPTRALSVLVGAQVALAIVLLIGAGLLTRSFAQLRGLDQGVDPGRTLTMTLYLPVTPQWRGDEVRRRFHGDLLDRVRQLDGVDAAGLVTRLPLAEMPGGAPVWPEDNQERSVRALLQTSSEGALAALGATLAEGRDLSAGDSLQAPRVAVINEIAARALWPDQSPLGRQLTFQHFRGPVTATVVGVIRPIRYQSLTAELRPEVFISFRQATVTPMQLVVRTGGDPLALMAPLRGAVAQVDDTRTVAVAGVSTLGDRFDDAASSPRLYMALFGTFAAAALTLGLVGVYSALAFWMLQRRREIGIRLALGASRRQVLLHVARRGMVVALAGAAAGTLLAIWAGGWLRGLLFGVSPHDGLTVAGAIALALAGALAACVLPARRASRLDPVDVLRAD